MGWLWHVKEREREIKDGFFRLKYNSFRRGRLHICSRVLFGRSKFEMIIDLEADVRLIVGCESASNGRGLGWRCTLRGHEQ